MSAPSRAFNGCRVLLAASRASSAAAKASSPTAATAAAPKTKSANSNTNSKAPKSSAKAVKKTRSPMSKPPGILKSGPVSPALRSFLGVSEASRPDATKKIWSYAKEHNLQNPDNKREINCDEKLKKLFHGKDKVGFADIAKGLSEHFIKTN